MFGGTRVCVLKKNCEHGKYGLIICVLLEIFCFPVVFMQNTIIEL